jgi:ankyrin repeat protein
MRSPWLGLFLLLPSPLLAETPLYWAIANNDALEVWHLTAEGTPDSLEENGLTLPAWAVERGSGEVIDVLTWRGVALDRVDNQGRNLLFGAAALGRLDLFEKIEAAGARVDQVDRQGLNLIHAAAPSPHPEMLKTLLARGLGAVSRSSIGVTPLMLACLGGRAEEAAILLDWGAVPEDQDYLGRSVRDYAVAGDDPATLAVVEAALTPWTISQDGGDPLP